MKKIDSKNIDTIINKMKSMLNEKELGVKVSFGGARYDSDSFRISLEVSLPNAKTKEEKALEHEIKVRNANKSWVKPLDPNKIAEIKNSQGHIKYSLCGYRPKARKTPFIVLNLTDNKKYIISEEKAERLFGDPNWKSEVNVKQYDKDSLRDIQL